MSTTVYPSLRGLGWPVTRSDVFKTRVQEAISGKEIRLADWSTPRHLYSQTYEFIEGAPRASDIATWRAFFAGLRGAFDSFLFDDVDDDAVAGQAIATGDAATTAFQLVRTLGGAAPENIYAPNVVSAVYLNGVAQSGSAYSVSSWGSSPPGVLTFVTAPGAGVAITADFTFYWPCRFVDDQIDVDKFMTALFSQKAVKFRTIK